MDNREFRILRRLAVGGMAELFLAEHVYSDPPAAAPFVVKRLLQGADATHRRLFDRERLVMERLSSPHVVRLLGSAPDSLFLEYVDGPDLQALLDHLRRRGRRLPLAAALAAIEGLLRGLADLHDVEGHDGQRLGAVHRDVNPSNVLVSGVDGATKLADMGVVGWIAGDPATVAGFRGTLVYMAPEQLLGRPVDARADLYSAGLVVWELLTGLPARPAGMNGLAELLDVRTRLPAAPSTVRRDLPSALDAVVLAALAPDPESRPSGALAWLESLRAAAGVAPDSQALASLARDVSRTVAPAIRTLPPQADEPPAPGPRPRRRIAAAIAAGVLAITAAVTLVAWPDAPRADDEAAAGSAAPTAPALDSPAAPLAPAASATAPAMPPPPAPGDAPASAPPAVRRPAPPAAKTAPAPAVLRIQVRAEGGAALHVLGAGARGLAPQTTAPLPDGASLVTLRGSPPGMPEILVRLDRTGERIRATLGTPAGRSVERIRCDGRDVGETAAVGLALERELHCSVTGGEGSVAFALVVVRS